MASSPGRRGGSGGGGLLLVYSHDKFVNINQVVSEGVATRVVMDLQKAGIYTCNGLLMQPKQNTIRLACLSESDVDKIIIAAEKLQKITAVGMISGTKVLDDELLEEKGIQSHIDDELPFAESMAEYLDQFCNDDRETLGSDLNREENLPNQLSDKHEEVPVNVCEIREEFLSKAKIAKELKRYDDMLNALWGIVMLHLELTVEEQHLLLAAYRNLIVENLEIRKVLKSLKVQPNEDIIHMKIISDYDNETANTLKNICLSAIEVMKDHILPYCSAPENKGFYLKIIGDCVWLISEYNSKESKLLSISLRAYEVAMLTMDNAKICRCNSLRLSLYLNSSALLHDDLRLYKRASEVASTAIGLCHTESLNEDSLLIMDLLRDNLRHWESDEAFTENQYDIHPDHLLLRTQPPSPVSSEGLDTIAGELGITASPINDLEDAVEEEEPGELGIAAAPINDLEDAVEEEEPAGEHGIAAAPINDLEDAVAEEEPVDEQLDAHQEVVHVEPVEHEEVNAQLVEHEEYVEVNEQPVEDQERSLTIIQVAPQPYLKLEEFPRDTERPGNYHHGKRFRGPRKEKAMQRGMMD